MLNELTPAQLAEIKRDNLDTINREPDGHTETAKRAVATLSVIHELEVTQAYVLTLEAAWQATGRATPWNPTHQEKLTKDSECVMMIERRRDSSVLFEYLSGYRGELKREWFDGQFAPLPPESKSDPDWPKTVRLIGRDDANGAVRVQYRNGEIAWITAADFERVYIEKEGELQP